MDVTQDMLTRRASAARKSSWNLTDRTFEVVVSTFADVRRWFGIERLSRNLDDWDLSRVDSPAGVPFLLAHDAYSLGAKIGRVLSIAVGKNDVRAVVQLGTGAAAEALVCDLETIGVACSFGYAVSRWERAEEDGAPEIRVAKAISILEVSAVSIAADPGAHVRSSPMTTKTKTNAPAIEPSDDDLESLGREEERTRVTEIHSMAVRNNMSSRFVAKHIKDGTAVADFGRAVLDKLAERTQSDGQLSAISVPQENRTFDNPAFRVRAMGEALYSRVDPTAQLSNEAREFGGLTIPEIARRCLEFRNEGTRGEAPAQLITRALHTTSDFPEILGTTVGRSLRAAYEAAPSAIKQTARKTTARDFKAKHALVFSEAPKLLKTDEHGEFKSGTFREAKASYKIDTFGRIFGITRQALINDDLDAFDQIPRKLGRAAEAFEAQFLVDLLTSNPALSDGVTLFHASHGNLASPASALAPASLSTARLAMRRQVGLTGELISVTPKFLIVAPDLETSAEELLADIAAAKVSDVNPFSGKLTPIVEPRLSGLTWYVAAAPSEIDGLEYAYLEGNEGPAIETEAGFRVDGIEIKVRLDYGAGFVEHRGWYKNVGAAPG